MAKAVRKSVKPSPKPAPKPAPKPVTKSTSVAVLPPPKSMLAVIANAAANPHVDVGKMKELLAMQREIEEREELREFNAALRDAQNEMPRIVKDRMNTSTNSRYATLEKVSKEIDHIARRHGFAMSSGTADSPIADHYRIVTDLCRGGVVRRYFVDLKSDTVGPKGTVNKTPVQGVGSTMSYGRRYLKVMIFDLVIVGEDSDGNREKEKPATISTEQAITLTEMIKAVGVEFSKVLEFFKIERLNDLPADTYDDAVRKLEAFDANKKAKEKEKLEKEKKQ